MVAICPQCRALNSGQAGRCALCGAALDQFGPAHVIVSASSLPPWRLEVAQGVEAYRVRQLHPGAPAAQPSLPFHHQPETRPARPPARASARPLVRPARQERVTIAVRQRDLDFPPVADRPDPKKAPVAALAARLRAGSYDALFLLGAYAGFLACFGLLGGQLLFSKLDAAIYLAALVLFYGLYFALFTTFGQITPGMRLAGLELTGFDGEELEDRQLLSRSFGYLIAGGSGFLGFLWALWDEDHLTWQDRISQTYLTPARASEPAAKEISPEIIEEEPHPATWRRLVPFQLFGTKRGSA